MTQPTIQVYDTVSANSTAEYRKSVSKERYVSLVELRSDTANALRCNVYVERSDGTPKRMVKFAGDGEDVPADSTEKFPYVVPSGRVGRLLQPVRMFPDDELVLEVEEYAGTTGGALLDASASAVSAISLDPTEVA